MTREQDAKLEQTRLNVLERRRRHLFDRMDRIDPTRPGGEATLAYDVAEIDTLTWALESLTLTIGAESSEPIAK